MPTGSGKSTLFQHPYTLMREVRAMCGETNEDPSWIFDDASFEKMGALMHENSSRLLAFMMSSLRFSHKSTCTGDAACLIRMS